MIGAARIFASRGLVATFYRVTHHIHVSHIPFQVNIHHLIDYVWLAPDGQKSPNLVANNLCSLVCYRNAREVARAAQKSLIKATKLILARGQSCTQHASLPRLSDIQGDPTTGASTFYSYCTWHGGKSRKELRFENESSDQPKEYNPVRYNAIGLIRNSGPWENHGAIKLRRTFKALSFLTEQRSQCPPASARNTSCLADACKFFQDI